MPEDNHNLDYPYSNREIREKWSDMSTDIKEVLEQAKKTNGRVSELEKWRYFMMGGMTIMTIIVVPLLAWALWILSGIESQVHHAVDEALTAYEINNENN